MIELIKKLEQAQSLLSDVYHVAGNERMEELERLMSVADSCILEAIELLMDEVENND